MPHWTITRMGPQTSKTAVVTGANSGIGYQAARQLAAHGAHVVLACRDPERGRQALERLKGEVSDASAELRQLDLASLSSVKQFAEGVDGPVNILINNAGVMAIPRRTTADGFEMQFGTNHLGHFALTGHLLDRLTAQPATRVVTVSSHMHHTGRINFDDLQGEKRYSKWLAYGQSKLANVLFATELGRRAKEAGLDITSLAVHPGYASTNLQTVGPKMSGSRFQEQIAGLGNRIFGQSDEDGALPTLFAATAEEAESGQYVGPSGLFGQRGKSVKPATPSKRARNAEDGRRLWEVSEELTGVRYLDAPAS